MSYRELFNLISKPLMTIKSIQQITGCSRNTADKIVKDIEKDIEKSGKKLLKTKPVKVPTSRVIEYLNLDIDVIADMATKEYQLSRIVNNASISE